MRVLRFLRSRRLAVILLIGLTVYAWVGSLVTSGAGGPAGTLIRRLGLEHPFSAPVFLAAIALVTLSTAACAWDRTLATLRAGKTSVTDTTLDRLVASPQFMVTVQNASLERAGIVAAAEAVLRDFRMKVRVTDTVITGSAWPYGIAGSALFHWALVGLFVFAGLGQLTRYEGYANVIQGRSILDSAEAYTTELTAGRLFGGGFSGLELGVAAVDLDLQVEGSSRGAATLVTLSSGDREIKRQWVYPNSPLRYGSMLVHNADTIPVFLGSIRTDGSTDVRTVTLEFDLAARSPQEFEFTDDATGASVTVAIVPLGNQRVEVTVDDGAGTWVRNAGIGESVEILPGQRLTVDDLTYAAQLHVVNDWSVPWLYAMFALGTLGVSAAVFVPTRNVSLAIVEDPAQGTGRTPGRMRMHVRYSFRRNDPAFPRLLEEALTRAVAESPATKREDRV